MMIDGIEQRPLSLPDILREEAAAIDGTILPSIAGAHADLTPLYRALNQRGYAALCLSGGGIRSAAFALGVIQRLAEERIDGATPTHVLAQFQYLSTVSGGGYIGSWLSAWLMRARIACVKDNEGNGSADVLSGLSEMTARAEAPAIENVRIDSNYLTPKVGAMSADLWAVIATYCRNLILNWVVIAPLVAVLVILAKLLQWGQFSVLVAPATPTALFAAGSAWALMVVPLSFRVANRPSVALANRRQLSFLVFDLGVTLLFAFVLSIVIFDTDLQRWTYCTEPGIMSCVFPGLAGAALYTGAWFAAPLWRGKSEGAPAWSPWQWEVLAWTTAGAVFGALCTAFWHFEQAFAPAARPGLAVVLGVPWVLSAHIAGSIVVAGLGSFQHRSSEDREWSARAAGWYVVAVVTWLTVGRWSCWPAPSSPSTAGCPRLRRTRDALV